MRILLTALSVLCASVAAAEPVPLTLPPVNVSATPTPPPGMVAVPTAPLVFGAAQSVRVQPSRLVLQLQPGYSTGTLTFTLLTDINAEVTVQAEDARLAVRDAQTPLRLQANQLQSVSALALAPHAGTFRVVNSQGAVIARVPYEILPPKTVNQSVYFTYSPSGKLASLSYGVSGIPQTSVDPRWSASVNMGVDTDTSKLSGGVSIGVSW